MGSVKRPVQFRGGAALLALAVVTSLAPATAAAEQRAPGTPDWQGPDPAKVRPWSAGNDPVAPPVPAAASAPRLVDKPVAPARAVLPGPDKADVTLGSRGEWRAAGASPVELAAGSAAGAGTPLRVEVLDRAAAERAGVAGFVFRVTPGAGERELAAPGGGALPVEIAIDYSGFARRYGSGYADRLRLVALPECALAAARPKGCRAGGAAFPTRRDGPAERLVAEVGDLAALSAGTGAVVLAVTSGPAGESGDFKASPLSVSSDWQVGVGSGEFSWSYEAPMPAPPAGNAPAVSLNYSSGSVDGMVSTRNTQAGQNGVGWADFASAFIERRYTTCAEEVDEFAAPFYDLCWKSDNATISLNGRASELVRMPGSSPTQWRLKRDPRWRVEQLTGTFANGDNDREYWRVTTPDGTQYFFGLGVNPDTNTATSSVWTVPVVGNHPGEPCRTSPGQICDQGWRWMLDRVVDPNDNVTTYRYFKETNKYLAVMGLQGERSYVRGGRLQFLEYGSRKGSTQAPAVKVEFGAGHRCAALDVGGTCPAPTSASSPADYPDVPLDLLCSSGCSQTSPTFFSTKRYTKIVPSVRVGTTFKPVDDVTLTHEHADNGGGDRKLYLKGVQRTGLAGATPLTLPGVTFDLVKLDNRVVAPGSTASRMPHYRMGTVTDEFGRKVTATYGRPHPCDNGDPYPTGGWDDNRYDCFPQQWTPEGGPTQFGIFHKWLVTQVRVEDTTGGSPAMTYTYGYGIAGDEHPAWHHDADEFVKLSDQSWSDWRGYGTATMTQGSSVTRYRVFRGMHDDRIANSTTTKTVDIHGLDDTTVTARDFNWLAGLTFDEAQLKGGATERGTLRTYKTLTTVDDDTTGGNEPDSERSANWSGEETATERRRTPEGGFARKRTTTAYNGFLHFPETVLEEGWLDQTGDERCTKTQYAFNFDAWMLDYPKLQALVRGACSSTTVMRESETSYDNGAVGVPPTRGNPTGSRTRLTSTAWASTATTYDALGRPLQVTDPNQHRTTTAYLTPSSGGYPTATEVTNHLGHKTRQEWFIERQAPAREINPNGKATSYTYDPLGRVTKAFQPTEPTSGPASWEFSYAIDPAKGKPPIVRTRRLQSTNPTVYVDAWSVYDSMLRERQNQRLSPAAGKVIVVDTSYDDRGNKHFVTPAEAVTGTPGTGVLPAPPAGWANRTQIAYDELSRPFWELFWAGTQLSHSTFTRYTHNSAAVDRHVGGDVVTVTDAYDRPVSVAEQDGSQWATTRYGYNAAGDLTTVTDPADHQISYDYDLAGRRTAMSDPDAGSWSYGYDPAGNQTLVTDARNVRIYTNYDAIDRPTERRKDSATTGTRLASWEYDAAGELGLLNRSSRWQHTGQHPGAYIVDVTGYDGRSRPTGRSWTLYSADVPGLEGVYQVGYGHDRADHLVSVAYPQVGDPQNGGLPAETVTTTYNSLGLPTKLDGTLLPTSPVDQDYSYATGFGYDDRARPAVWGYGATTGSSALLTLREYDANQRLGRMQANAAGTVVQDRQIGYDPVGNITERNTTLAAKTWRECFGYDQRIRLTRAYTTAPADTCAGTPGAGDANFAYHHTYSYSTDGNLTRRVEGADQTNTFSYSYPAGATAARPHAATAIDGPSASDDWTYTWDANGQQATRTVGGNTDTVAWGPDRFLDEIREANGNVKNSFVYDADGSRLVRRHVDGATAYIEGHEINANNSGSEIKVVRTYTLDGAAVGTRTAHGVDHLVADNQNSVELVVPSGSNTPSVTRAYLPYGGERGTTDEPATDRGWIGQIEDDRTGLNYLNARYYDPVIGRFLTTDPLYDLARPQTINPYAYGLNNPVTHADPSGLCVPVGADAGSPCITSGMSQERQQEVIHNWSEQQADPGPACCVTPIDDLDLGPLINVPADQGPIREITPDPEDGRCSIINFFGGGPVVGCDSGGTDDEELSSILGGGSGGDPDGCDGSLAAALSCLTGDHGGLHIDAESESPGGSSEDEPEITVTPPWEEPPPPETEPLVGFPERYPVERVSPESAYPPPGSSLRTRAGFIAIQILRVIEKLMSPSG